MTIDLPYELRTEGNRLIEGWAQQRLPFEPKGWMKDFRDELRVAIRGLVADRAEALHATYTNPQTDRVDIENALDLQRRHFCLSQLCPFGALSSSGASTRPSAATRPGSLLPLRDSPSLRATECVAP